MNDTDKIMELVLDYSDAVRTERLTAFKALREAIEQLQQQLASENDGLREQNTTLDQKLAELESEQAARSQDDGKLERQIERLQQQLTDARSEATALRVNEQNLEARLAAVPAQREPLTQDQRDWLIATCLTPASIIRAVEAAHGIGSKP